MQHQLSSRLIAALNFARAVAAFYVVLQHVAQARGWNQGWLGVPLRFGQEAVLVFFVLSGFVIFASEYRANGIRQGYTSRRVRRIYPALIIALLLSTLVIWDNGELTDQFNFTALLGTIAGLQDVSFLKPGVITDAYLHNDPLWSLSYELFFYTIFPLVAMAWRRSPRITNHAIGLTSCLCYAAYRTFPNHWFLVIAYFLIWWVGAMAADAYLRGGRSAWSLRVPILWLGALIAVSAVVSVTVGIHGIGYYPLLMTRHFAVAMALVLLFYSHLGRWLAGRIERLSGVAAFFASISYGVYVFHLPLLVQWRRAQTVAGFVMAAALLITAAVLFDRSLNRWLSRTPGKTESTA